LSILSAQTRSAFVARENRCAFFRIMLQAASGARWHPGQYGTHVELLLAFWAAMGSKPGRFMTIGMNRRALRGLTRVAAPSHAVARAQPIQRI
jgi:hypothetical protein